MKLYNMIGYKLFKQREDGSIHMIRIVGVRKPFKINSYTKDPSEISIYDYDTKEKKKVLVESLKDYTPLEPDGIAVFSIVNIRDSKGVSCKDIVVTGTKFINVKYKVSNMPFVVCRQNITDVFYNLIAKDENDTLVGMSINQDNCPAQFDFRLMLAADSIVYSDFINFYRVDTLDDILKMVKLNKFDEVLSDLFTRHINHIKKPELMFKNEHGGWCKNLKTLLTQNNFMADINEMLGIVQVDFKLSDYETTVSKKDNNGNNIEYKIARDDLRLWLSSIYNMNMSEIAILEFDHDINLADFNDTRYLLIRDITNTLYIAVYTIDGEFYEKDLEEKSKELDFSSKFKLSFETSKYANN